MKPMQTYFKSNHRSIQAPMKSMPSDSKPSMIAVVTDGRRGSSADRSNQPNPIVKLRATNEIQPTIGGLPIPLKNISSSIVMIIPNIWIMVYNDDGKHCRPLALPGETAIRLATASDRLWSHVPRRDF